MIDCNKCARKNVCIFDANVLKKDCELYIEDKLHEQYSWNFYYDQGFKDGIDKYKNILTAMLEQSKEPISLSDLITIAEGLKEKTIC